MIFRQSNRLATIITVCCLSGLGCFQADRDAPETNTTQATSKPKAEDNERAPTATAIPRDDGPTDDEYPALHNLLQVSDRLYSGGEPHGDEAFASLARLGVKMVVSVDGAKPDVHAARKHGLRYVHIPIGYGGIDKEAGLSLARLVSDAEGPFYIHCHHGRHRGPAAAAVACVATGDVDGKGAIKILERAGTGKGYAGLWRDVERYQVPCDDAVLPALVEVAEIGSFAGAMAQIDRAYDNLRLCRDARWSTPDEHPDLVPAHEALLLKEGLRESARNLPDEFGDEFRTWITEAESIAQNLEDSCNAGEPDDELSKRFQALTKSCNQCHEKYRN